MRVTPDRLRISVRGQARLRVEGRGRGWLRVGSESRWVWDDFDESFALWLSKGGSVEVALWRLGRPLRQRVACELIGDLRPPSAQILLPTLRSKHRFPDLRPLNTRGVAAPRVVRLRPAPLESERAKETFE